MHELPLTGKEAHESPQLGGSLALQTNARVALGLRTDQGHLENVGRRGAVRLGVGIGKCALDSADDITDYYGVVPSLS